MYIYRITEGINSDCNGYYQGCPLHLVQYSSHHIYIIIEQNGEKRQEGTQNNEDVATVFLCGETQKFETKSSEKR